MGRGWVDGFSVDPNASTCSNDSVPDTPWQGVSRVQEAAGGPELSKNIELVCARGGGLMDSSTLKHLMGQFAKMVARPDLKPGFPEQYVKHWENQGRSGKVQIVAVQLVDQP